MAELVPDSWRFQGEEQNKHCHQNRHLRRGPVSDMLLWIECYASMVAVLSSGFPQKIPELMAYQKTIVRAYRSFSGDGWVTYDACYRGVASNEAEEAVASSLFCARTRARIGDII